MGQVGLRSGAITGSADQLLVRLTGPGGHTARPHLTADLVFALGKVVTELPAALSRRVDPRAALSLVWGRVGAGRAANAIPTTGEVEGTVRCLDSGAWNGAPELVRSLVADLVAPYGVQAEVTYTRNVPPVDNEPTSVEILTAAVQETEGPDAVVGTEQSLGGEDFAWYLPSVPGALARLGVSPPEVPDRTGGTCTRGGSTPTSAPSRWVPGSWWARRTSPCSRSDNGLCDIFATGSDQGVRLARVRTARRTTAGSGAPIASMVSGPMEGDTLCDG